MKIEIELSRLEAHELNYILSRGAQVVDRSRAANRALVVWNEAYLKGMSE